MATPRCELDDLEAHIARLEARLAQFETAVAGMPQGLCLYDKGTVAVFNPAYERTIGVPPGTLRVGMPSKQVTQAMIDAGRYPGKSLDEVEHYLQRRFLDGMVSDVRLARGEATYSANCLPLGEDVWLASFQDITPHIAESKRVAEALRDSEERFRLAAEAAGFGIWDYDMDADDRAWSDRLRQILGLCPEEKETLENALQAIHPEDRDGFHRALIGIRDTGGARFEATVRVVRPIDNAERWVTFHGWKTVKADKEARRIIMTVRDVTDEKLVQERIKWAAMHDSLTGLGNRSFFQHRLEDALAQAGGSAPVGLLMLDIDFFKQINDTLGHDAGDELLKMFASRLRSITRSSDAVARLGGDEFAIILSDLREQDAVTRLASSILTRMREPFVYQGRILDCRASIGAALSPAHGHTPAELLKHADLALYASKAAGRGTSTLFRSAMKAEALKRDTMIQLARSALREERVLPYYQPKIDLASGRVTGFEALLRWRTRNGRIKMPASVEAAFADLELAKALSECMMDQVVSDLRGWLEAGLDVGHVALNASAADFRREDFAETVLGRLSRADIATRHFELEVTETVFLGQGAENVQRALRTLSDEGVTIALDDFGTGYASLRHLKQFPVDTLKIDRSFVRDMLVDSGDEAIIRAVINLGNSLAINVVAEGIEHPDAARQLVDLGCRTGQGFLFSKAVPAARVPHLLRQRSLYRVASRRAGAAPLRLLAG